MQDKQLNDQIIDVMFALSRTLKEGMTYDSDTAQLTLVQLQSLIFIKRHESVTMSAIAKELKITLPTATVLSDKLVHADLIERTNDKNDRRIVKLIITEKGNKLLSDALKQRKQKVNKMLSYLKQEEKEQLLHIMRNMLNNIEIHYEK